MRTFTHKGYGRIYVEHLANIGAVRKEIKEMDAFEYDYLPNDLVAPFSDYPLLAYTHKFSDIDIDLLAARLWKKGVRVFCLDNGTSDMVKQGGQGS